MDTYSWDPEKNEWLIENRGLSFERITCLIEAGAVLDIIQHPNAERYPKQRMFIINIDNYAHLVPFVETEGDIFLKTIIPSRKATKQYLGGL
jgi:uncharacterized DUF497 family protein